MIKHLTRHGNSFALVIDRPILDLLQIQKDTPLSVTTDGKRLIISPVQGFPRGERLRRAMNEVEKRYAPAFRRLAKS